MKTTFDEYSTRYRHVEMQREAGVLELRLHSDGGPLVWGSGPHSELGYCFADVGSDPDNQVIILTGTGDRFIADLDKSWVGDMTPTRWDEIYRNGKRLLMNLLEIEVPMISAVNGPATSCSRPVSTTSRKVRPKPSPHRPARPPTPARTQRTRQAPLRVPRQSRRPNSLPGRGPLSRFRVPRGLPVKRRTIQRQNRSSGRVPNCGGQPSGCKKPRSNSNGQTAMARPNSNDKP